MPLKSVEDERTQKEILFDRLLHVGEVARVSLKKGKDISDILFGLQSVADRKWGKDDRISEIVRCERYWHSKFFGHDFDLTDFENKLRLHDKEEFWLWYELGLEPHFLPKVEMGPNDEYPGWAKKPSSRYYDYCSDGELFMSIDGEMKKVDAIGLDEISVLIDMRMKPFFIDHGYEDWKPNGGQMFEDDNLLGPIIGKLRGEKRIPIMTNTSGGSRFGISPNEWEGMVKSELGMLLSLDSRQEKLIEINIIPQLYKRTLRANEGRTTTLVWSEESIEDKRRIATDGLMQLSIHGAEERFIDVGIRPMFIL